MCNRRGNCRGRGCVLGGVNFFVGGGICAERGDLGVSLQISA